MLSNTAYQYFIGTHGNDKDDKLDYDKWYGSETLAHLNHIYPKSTSAFRYILLEGQCFIKQFSYLRQISAALEYANTSFIGMEPSKTISSHFIMARTLGPDLLIINPLGLKGKKDFYEIIKQLKEQGLIQKVYLSTTKLQLDEDGVVSCGPICMELLLHFAELGTKSIQQRLIYHSENSKHTLDFIPVDITPLLPDSLRKLTSDNYKKDVQNIRAAHAKVLQVDSPNNKQLDQLLSSENPILPIEQLMLKLLAEDNDQLSLSLKRLKSYPEFKMLREYLIEDPSANMTKSTAPVATSASFFKMPTSLSQVASSILPSRLAKKQPVSASSNTLGLLQAINKTGRFSLSEDMALFLEKILQMFLGKLPANWKIYTPSANSLFIPLSSNNFGLELATNGEDYIFTLRNRDGSDIAFPGLKKFNAVFGIDLQQELPNAISHLYQSMSLARLEFCYGVNSSIYTEIKCKQINILGLDIDEIKIPLQLTADDEGKLRLQAAIIIHSGGLAFSGELPDKPSNWSLKASYSWAPQPKNISDFIKPLVGEQLPAWLIEQPPSISSLNGEVWPGLGEWRINIQGDNSQSWKLFSINGIPVSIGAFDIALSRDNAVKAKAAQTKAVLRATLQIDTFTIPMVFDSSKGIKAAITGKIEREKASKLLSTLISKFGFEKNMQSQIEDFINSIAVDVGFSISSQELLFTTANLSFCIYKAKKRWITLIEYKKPSTDNDLSVQNILNALDDEAAKELVSSILKPVSSIDLWAQHVSHDDPVKKYKKGFKTVLKLPLHEIPGVKTVIQGELFVPLTFEKPSNEKFSIKVEDIKLVGTIDFGIARLEDVTLGLDVIKKSIALGGTLDINIARLQGKLLLALTPFSVNASFTLKANIAILGLVINQLKAAMAIESSKLSGSVSAKFTLPQQAKEIENQIGEIGGSLSPKTGGLSAFNATFPRGYTLSMSSTLQLVMPPDEWKKSYFQGIDATIKRLFPLALGPVDDPDFISALNQSSNESIKSLLSADYQQLTLSVDIESLSARLAAQLKITELFTAFIMLEAGLKQGITLVGSIMPINLFNGLLKVTRSQHTTDRQPPLETAGPVIFLRIPGTDALLKPSKLKEIGLHFNAYVYFLGIAMDSYVDISATGFDLHVHPSIKWPILAFDSKLDIQVREDRFLFEMDTQLSFTIPQCKVLGISIPEIKLLGAKTRLRVEYNHLQQTPFTITGSCSLELLKLEVSLNFNFQLSQADCRSLKSLIAAVIQQICSNAVDILCQLEAQVLQKIVKQCNKVIEALAEAGKAVVGALVFIGEKVAEFFEWLGESFEALLFPEQTQRRKQIQAYQERNIKLCMFRYLLRANTDDKLLQAFHLSDEIVKVKLNNTELNHPMYVLNQAIAAMEHEPLLAFCYLRMIDVHLLPLEPINEEDYRIRAFTRYLLGVLYANKRVPMAEDFKSNWDEMIEKAYQDSTYLTDEQLKEKAISLFVQSYQDILRADAIKRDAYDLNRQQSYDKRTTLNQSLDKTLNPSVRHDVHQPPASCLLALYQLYKHKDSIYVEHLRYSNRSKFFYLDEAAAKGDDLGDLYERITIEALYQQVLGMLRLGIDNLSVHEVKLIPIILFEYYTKYPGHLIHIDQDASLNNFLSTNANTHLVKAILVLSNFIGHSELTKLSRLRQREETLILQINHLLSRDLAENDAEIDKLRKELREIQSDININRIASVDHEQQYLQEAVTEIDQLISTIEGNDPYEPLVDSYYITRYKNYLYYIKGLMQSEFALGLHHFWAKHPEQDWQSGKASQQQILQKAKEFLEHALEQRVKQREIWYAPTSTEEAVEYISISYFPYNQAHKKLGDLYLSGVLHQEHQPASDNTHTSGCHHCMAEAERHYATYLRALFSEGFNEKLSVDKKSNAIGSVTQRNEKIMVALDQVDFVATSLAKINAVGNSAEASGKAVCENVLLAVQIAKHLHDAQAILKQSSTACNSEAIQKMLLLQTAMLRFQAIQYLLFAIERNCLSAFFELETYVKEQANKELHIAPHNSTSNSRVATIKDIQQVMYLLSGNSLEGEQSKELQKDRLAVLQQIIESLDSQGYFNSEMQRLTISFTSHIQPADICQDLYLSDGPTKSFQVADYVNSARSIFANASLSSTLSNLQQTQAEIYQQLSNDEQSIFFNLRNKASIFKMDYPAYCQLNLENNTDILLLENELKYYEAQTRDALRNKYREIHEARFKNSTRLADASLLAPTHQKPSSKPKRLAFSSLFPGDPLLEDYKLVYKFLHNKKAIPNVEELFAHTESEVIKRSIAHFLGQQASPLDRLDWNKLFLVAAKDNNPSIVKLLLRHNKADIDFMNPRYGTALHLAIRNKGYEIANLLLNEGADTSLQDGEGNTPLELALKNNAPATLIQGLLEHNKQAMVGLNSTNSL